MCSAAVLPTMNCTEGVEGYTRSCVGGLGHSSSNSDSLPIGNTTIWSIPVDIDRTGNSLWICH